MAENDISPEHLLWVVRGRSDNQENTMALYKAIYESDDLISLHNPELHEAAQDLLGIAFSLWRSVFLSDTNDEFTDQRAEMKKFLISLISDNAIMYITDKNSRNWSFRYYLNNAIFRLEKLSRERLSLVDPGDLRRDADSDKDEWINAQAAFSRAVGRFAEALKSAGQ